MMKKDKKHYKPMVYTLDLDKNSEIIYFIKSTKIKPIFGRIMNDIFHYTSLKTKALKPDLRKNDMTDT